ncbi:MAG: DNA-3-methyladenine glycosylase [Candidatus Paceibacterota bacterium]
MSRLLLKKSFYEQSAPIVARQLLGKYLVGQTSDGPLALMITETESYGGAEDLASHAAGGKKTKRNEVMYGPPGHWYVYLVYGLHYMLNVVTEPAGRPAGRVIRAVAETAGPGRVGKLFEVNREDNREPANQPNSRLVIEDRGFKVQSRDIVTGPRIGVSYAGPVWSQKPFRFYLKNMVK